MKVSLLKPFPEHRENFRRDRQRFIPAKSGCYALVSFEGVVLYVGLTRNLRRRFGDHLDDPGKRSLTEKGRAFFFYWLQCDEFQKVERTWQHECELVDGNRPILNRICSPISV
ncbi:MAG: GIY-YIG nuclease family protein [Acidobacteriota bacterium]|nr:GIY-YIG nuclease family protein [Acidobacteriota bacterium]